MVSLFVDHSIIGYLMKEGLPRWHYLNSMLTFLYTFPVGPSVSDAHFRFAARAKVAKTNTITDIAFAIGEA